MYIKSVIAYRIGDTVDVLVLAELPRSCDKAKIQGTYPGSIFHPIDPGKAEVFINFYQNPAPCPTVMQPWLARVQIKDTNYDEVDIFINGERILTAPIFNF